MSVDQTIPGSGIPSDAAVRKTPKDLPPIQTGLTNKPLPPIRQPRAVSPPRSIRYANMRAPSINVSTVQPTRRNNAKMTLFSLFSRPKVEKLRGYVEPGLIVPIQEPESRGTSPELIIQIPSPLASEFPPPRPSTALSFRTTASRNDRPRSRERRSDNTWVAPPIFQVYSQSIKASVAETLGPEGIHGLRVATNSTLIRSDRNHRHGSIGYSALPRKVFALCKTGHILQYADKGLSERGPEKILQLTEGSAAYACDIVPGRPFALQIAQAVDVCGVPITSSVSILSRIGIKTNSARREAATMTLVLDSPEELDAWMIAVREQIRCLGGTDKQIVSRNDVEERAKSSAPSHRAPSQPSTRRLSVSSGVRLRTSMDFVTNASDSDSRVHKGPQISRPRRASEVVSPSNGLMHFRTLETAAVKESSRESLPIPAANAAGLVDLASPDSPDDSAITAEQVRKQFPFKIRSTIPVVIPSNTTTPDSSPPSSKKRMTSINNNGLLAPRPADDIPRPDSFVVDLPMMPQHRVLKSQTSSNTLTKSPYAKDSNIGNSARTCEPYKPRRLSSAPLNLPLRVNPSVSSTPIHHSPHKNGSANTSSARILSGEEPVECSLAASITAPPRNPNRTVSVKLSLFPSPDAAPPPTSHAATRAVQSAADISPNTNRPLRRPASLQIRTTAAPFLQSVPRSSSTTRPTLDHSASTPSLRSAGSAAVKHCANPSHSVANSRVRRLHSERIEVDDSDLTALPLPPLLSPAPRGRSKAGNRSPLPALDLGIPIIGLAPPAPPPERSLPLLPPLISPTFRTMAV